LWRISLANIFRGEQMALFEKKNDISVTWTVGEGQLGWIKVIAMKLQRFFVTRAITLTVLEHAGNSQES
jgi:hypothetical protein